MDIQRIEDKFAPEVGITWLDLLCYRNQKSCLYELRLILGDKNFMFFCNLLAGSYLLIPPSGKQRKLGDEYALAVTVKRLVAAKRKHDLREWSQQESKLQYISKKTGIKYPNLILKGKRLLKEFQTIKVWSKEMDRWKYKFLGDE